MLARGSVTTELTRLRYVGLAGSLALAAGAYQVGARPGLAEADGLPPAGQAPGLLACLAGLIALIVAWWCVGRRLPAGASDSPGGRWMLVTAALWAAPVLAAPPLASRDIYAYACQGALIQAGLDPHVLGAAALPCPWLDSVPQIWRDAPSPYGPLFGLLSAGTAALSNGNIIAAVAALRLVAVAGVLLAVWFGRTLARSCGVTEARAAWLGLASPLVVVHVFSGGHNDALLAGLVIASLGLAASPSSRPAGRLPAFLVGPVGGRGMLAGTMLGLAVAVKATALVVLPFVVLLLVPGPRSWRRLGGAGAAVGAATVLTYALIAAVSGLGLGFLHGLTRTGELAQWTSIPTAVGMSAGYALRLVGVESAYDVAVAVARLVGLAAAAAVVIAASWTAWRAPQPVRTAVVGAGVAMGAVVLLGPVFYPWYALTPLALLAVSVVDLRTRAWLGVASGALAAVVLPNGTGLAPRTKLPGALVITMAVLAALAIGARWLRAPPRRSRTPGS